MKLALMHVGGMFGLGVFYLQGLLFLPFTSDRTHLSVVIGIVFIGGVIEAFRSNWGRVEKAIHILPALGLLGTILGFLIMLKGGVSADDLSGVYTALYTTLIGMIGMIWLTLCSWVR